MSAGPHAGGVLFWLKKVLSFWLMPLPACLVLLLAGVALTRRDRRRRFGRLLLVTGLTLLIAFTNKAVSRWLIQPIEATYPAILELSATQPAPAALTACRYVVVLGSGHSDMPTLAATSELSPAGLGRLGEAVRLLRALPDATLIVSGPGEDHGEAHARVLARAAESLGVAPERIQMIDTARDTEDEAHAVRERVGGARVALVTSAWHMRRAAALFHHAGVDALPCPADFQGKANPDFRWTDYGWDAESLYRSTCAVHEYLGYLWTWLRGKT